jgi:hypothetical protein
VDGAAEGVAEGELQGCLRVALAYLRAYEGVAFPFVEYEITYAAGYSIKGYVEADFGHLRLLPGVSFCALTLYTLLRGWMDSIFSPGVGFSLFFLGMW